MILTRKQEEAVRIGRDRYRAGEKATVIAGYAGSGKSTSLQHIIEAININPEEIAYATFTGKAALVLRQKGFNAQTLHKLLYDTQKIGNHFIFRAKRKLDKPYKIVVVDELSMVPMTLMRLLAKHNVHVIGLGDPFQLPPIADDNLMLNNPHIFLDEVMRQAQESEILRLSMDIREGKPLQLFNGNELKVIDKKDIVDGMYLWADTIICGRNNTRRQINHKVRGMRGATSLTPEEGDKLVCLRNYWESESEVSFDPMINGMIGYAHNIGTPCEATGDIPLYFQPDYLNEGDGFKVSSDCNIFNWQDPREEDVPYNGKIIEPGVELDYGYAITCWKSQGSEFDKVMFFGEKLPHLSKTDYKKYLYTGITRAKKRLILVREG